MLLLASLPTSASGESDLAAARAGPENAREAGVAADGAERKIGTATIMVALRRTGFTSRVTGTIVLVTATGMTETIVAIAIGTMIATAMMTATVTVTVSRHVTTTDPATGIVIAIVTTATVAGGQIPASATTIARETVTGAPPHHIMALLLPMARVTDHPRTGTELHAYRREKICGLFFTGRRRPARRASVTFFGSFGKVYTGI